VLLVLLTSTSTVTSVLALAAATGTTVLIMGGTGHPLSTPPDTASFVQRYVGTAVDNYVSPSSAAAPATGIPAGPYNRVAVITPEQFAPGQGGLTFDQSVAEGGANLDKCISANGCAYNPDVGSTAPSSTDRFVVFGYSQSATIGTFEKRRLSEQFANGEGPDVSFVFIGNGNRPNGGFLARGPQGFTIPIPLPYGGATFSGPTPTNTQYNTVDIAGQYDVWADFPLNPLNLVADANAVMGSTVHANYENVSLSDPGIVNQGRVGDTTYYLIPTAILPLLNPVEQLPFVGHPLADALDAPLRVLVEAGYNRTISPGQPAPWNPLYLPNPVALGANFLAAIPTGLDNGLQDVIGIRPFGTQRPGPYGVGGPEVTYLNPPATKPETQRNPDPVTAAGDSLNTLSDDVPVSRSTSAPSPLSATKVADDASTPAATTTQSADNQKPTDPIKAVTSAVQHVVSGSTANDASTAAKPTPSANNKESTDPIKATVGAIRHALSGNTGGTTTTSTTRTPTSATSTTPGPEASGTSSSTASDGARKAVDLKAR
jgi:hypothetical protein